MSTPTVLFLCQHNAGRSQLGAALLEILAPGDYSVTSAGTSPADAVNPAIAATIAEVGLDITSRIPRAVTPEDLATADIVVAMKPGLALPAAPSGRFLEWSFPDPTDWTPENVRPLREAVTARLRDEILTA
ncbi:low molecular weight phosphatase family protein [Microbacterium sp. SD291]|uniref:arsenate-mycothiol transferase ArsC n=1 Tax=Microbacterium sp. SD291 TaxID=2782007 RepID=UPI001A95AA59|nr:low molecular weight phosphatase family protein [Microbacterium sp. SD291]MBO0979281.1 low molecular weight phosphatase family protein [Microbacterium sp. SD291]